MTYSAGVARSRVARCKEDPLLQHEEPPLGVDGDGLEWERPQLERRLTPCRTLRGFAALLAAVGTPARAPKPCGRSPGKPKGRLSGRAKRYPALKKAA
jgi:hypothetical protein